jgi:hypothetical protein
MDGSGSNREAAGGGMAWIKRVERKSGPRFKVGWRDPSGRARYKTFPRLSLARAFKTHLEHSQVTGTYVEPSRGRITVSEQVEHFLTSSPNLAPTTVALYETVGCVHVGPVIGDVRLNTFAPADIKRFIADIQGQGVGASTIHVAFRLLRRVLEVAVEEEIELAVTGDGLREQGRPARRGRCLLTAPLERPNVETAR